MSSPPVSLVPGATSGTQSKGDAALECRLKSMIDGGPAAIADRLGALEREWTAGRAVKATVGVLIVAGLVLSLSLSLIWLVLPIIGGAILLQYLFARTSLIGEMFHFLGLRSGAEIEREKMALRVLRGDFALLPTVHTIEDRDAVSRMEGEGGPAIEREEKQDAHAAVKELIDAVRP